jgi:hypothetical protein
MAFDFNAGLRGALSGGGSLLATGNPWLIGAGGLMGLLSGFGGSAEDEYRRREQYLIDRAKEIYGNIRRQGVSDINAQTGAAVRGAGRTAARRAAAAGQEAGPGLASAESAARNAGAMALHNFLMGIGQREQEAELGASQAYAGRPIQPSIADILGAVGPAISGGINQYTLNQAMRKYYGLDEGDGGGEGELLRSPGKWNPAGLTGPAKSGASPGFSIAQPASGRDVFGSYRSQLYNPPWLSDSSEIPPETIDLSQMIMSMGREPNYLFPRRASNLSTGYRVNAPLPSRPMETYTGW